ncbi:hypothetical protein F4810DRAFT_712141 [Camillea tinctor]|nr:hypothetical protein F4810DRAFT_712141 [Camillea tinctor]
MSSPAVSASTVPAPTVPHDEEVPTIQFTNVKELIRAVRRVSADFAVVQNVPPTEFENISLLERRPFRVRRYLVGTGVLFIAIPTRLHEVLHSGIYHIYLDQLGPRRKFIWNSIGATTYRERGHPGGDGGEGDSTGGPNPERRPGGTWPTLVVEAGVSEPLSELHQDMRWWFSVSNHQVKIVILAKFNYSRQQIIIERWEEEPRARPGATMTRLAAAFPSVALLQPVLRQSIIITKNEEVDPVSYNVVRGALIIPFRLLFLREPGPGEGDFIIDIPDLQYYAGEVWEYA